MSAVVLNPQKRWNGKVPFVIGNIAPMGKVWLMAKLKDFNIACDHEVFVARQAETDYIEFEQGSNSDIGRQGGKQTCRVSTTNLYHEAGHALGLGHSYFDTRSRLPTLFQNVDLEAYNLSRVTYTNFGTTPHAASMMAYHPGVFPNSPRIKRVVDLAQSSRGQLSAVRANAVRRQAVAQQGQQPVVQNPPPRPRLVRSGSGGNLRRPPQPLQAPQRNPNDINQMTHQEVTQFIADLDIVNEYWTFEDGFMLKVHAADKASVRHVLGLV